MKKLVLLGAALGSLLVAPAASARPSLTTAHARHLVRRFERSSDGHHIRVHRCHRISSTTVQCRVVDRFTSDWTLDGVPIVMDAVSLDTVRGTHVHGVVLRFWN